MTTADKPAWAPDYHASAMMVPVVFVTWTLSVLFATLAAYVALRLRIRCAWRFSVILCNSIVPYEG